MLSSQGDRFSLLDYCRLVLLIDGFIPSQNIIGHHILTRDEIKHNYIVETTNQTTAVQFLGCLLLTLPPVQA